MYVCLFRFFFSRYDPLINWRLLKTTKSQMHGETQEDGKVAVNKSPMELGSLAGAGWFHQDVYAFSRKPYSIHYRAKIQYLIKDQTPAMGHHKAPQSPQGLRLGPLPTLPAL